MTAFGGPHDIAGCLVAHRHHRHAAWFLGRCGLTQRSSKPNLPKEVRTPPGLERLAQGWDVGSRLAAACIKAISGSMQQKFFHAADALGACPGKSLTADTDAVTSRLAVADGQVKVGVRCINDDGAGRLDCGVINEGATKRRR